MDRSPAPRTAGFGAMVLVAAGGAAGTAARYALTEALPAPGFPLATLLINVAGAFLLGALVSALARLAAARPALAESLRLLFGTGLLGGFTTYSALAVDSVTAESVVTAVLYATATLVLGLAAAWAGMLLLRRRE